MFSVYIHICVGDPALRHIMKDSLDFLYRELVERLREATR